MKEKIIEVLYMESYASENGVNLSSEDFEEVADKIIDLVQIIVLENGEEYLKILK